MESSSAPAIGAVLAGGAGTRLGGAKARTKLGGRPLIEYPIAAAEAAGLEPVVVAKPDSQLPPLAVEIIREPDRPRHPLCGIVAALRRAAELPAVVVGCDMPFVSPALLSWLASTREPLVVPVLGGRPQPLLARYGASLLPELEAALAAEEPLQRTVRSLRPRLLPERTVARFGDPQRLALNVNAATDIELAERLLG
jgi:molybdopterin-guanine dinucleotide biosynthesis protein A